MGHHESSDGPTHDGESGPLLHVTSRQLQTAVVISATGQVDLSTAQQLSTAVRTQFDGYAGLVVIDLSGVSFLGSIGLAVLLEAQNTAFDSGRTLRIVVGDGRTVRRAIDTAGLSDHLPVFRHLDEVVAPA